MKNHWLEQARERLEAEAKEPADVRFDRLLADGIINDRGEVTGHLHRWDSYLAITEVKHSADGRRIELFRCLKPVFGMPGDKTIDVHRDSMVDYLKSGKKIITARHDARLDMWREGCDVHLSTDGFVRCNSATDPNDCVGALPEFQQASSDA